MKIKSIYILMIMIFLAAGITSCAKNNLHSAKSVSAPPISLPYKRIHFLFDKDEVIQSEMSFLDKNAEWLKARRDVVIILEGHCDENGPKDYNMELGDRRARAVKAYLIERGVPYDRVIMVVSYGNTRPIDPSHDNDAWKQNRRVEFIVR